MLDPLPIQPIRGRINTTLTLPGSKSITNRALILAALSSGQTQLDGALFSRDTTIMLNALCDLGFKLVTDEASLTIQIEGLGGSIPNNEAFIHVGNAGTAARFLTAFVASNKGGVYHMDGDLAMRERPISGLLRALTDLGAAEFEFHEKPDHFPFTLRAKGYQGGVVSVDSYASSQILSALLLMAASGGAVKLKCPEVRPHYVALTLEMIQSFGAAPTVISKDGEYTLTSTRYVAPQSGHYAIEPDLSAASYFLALTLIHGGSLCIPNISQKPLQGDARFFEVLAHHGLSLNAEQGKWLVSCKSPDQIQKDHREIDFNRISDTFLTYAAIAPLLGESVSIVGIGHTRHQETDRIKGMAQELSKLGQLVKEDEGALTIQPKPRELRARALRARETGEILSVETYEDHRFAMSFAVLGSFDLLGDGKPWLAIKDPNCCAKTFPNFFKALKSLRDV
ncbi:MAG: 3-phosphoshikimate 1-carboxyvinyltransferase [Verrucomicrobiota bacterium]|nr:3-phosphoshikimate 1-carboxyvinyltransferase [Verrucomicrobiota bacterium]